MKRLGSLLSLAMAGMAAAPLIEMQPPPPSLDPLPRRARRLPNPPRANLSRRHRDYGMTPAQHEDRKAEHIARKNYKAL